MALNPDPTLYPSNTLFPDESGTPSPPPGTIGTLYPGNTIYPAGDLFPGTNVGAPSPPPGTGELYPDTTLYPDDTVFPGQAVGGGTPSPPPSPPPPPPPPYVPPPVIYVTSSPSGRAALATYKFELARSSDLTRIGELTQARDRTLQLALNRAGALNFWMPMDDPMAMQIAEVETCVIVSRDAVPIWSGPVWTTSDTVDASQARLDVTCVGWLQTLEKRVVRPSWGQPTYSDDAGMIAFALLNRSNEDANAAGAPSYVTPGGLEGTQPRTRTYQPWTGILQAITELSEIESGYDMYVDPWTRKLNIYSQKGSDRGVYFELGSNVASVRQGVDSSRIANYITAYSAADSAADANAGSLSDLGLFEEATSLSDVVNPGILQAYAAGEVYVKSRPLPIVTFKPMQESIERPDDPRWIRDFDIGDYIHLTARRGRINFDRQLLRIFTFSVRFPDTGGAAVDDIQTALA